MNSIMIYATTQEKAENKLNELTKNLPTSDVLYRTNDTVKTEGGLYRARKWNQCCRGYRYQDVYIDNDLKEYLEDITCKIRPPLERWNEPYNYKEHVFWF